MLKIYEKNLQEVENEQHLFDCAAKLVDGIPKTACKTYIIVDGIKTDTSDLTEEQIINFCRQCIINCDIKKQTTNKDYEIFKEACKLIECVENYYKPSYRGLKCIINMYYNKSTSSMAKDIFARVADKKLIQIHKIASFLEESKGNFKSITREQMLEVVSKMQENETIRRNTIINNII